MTQPVQLAFLTLALLAGARDVRFASGSSATCIPFDASNRQVLVEATIDGRRTAWIAVDTGSWGSVLDETVAADLGLTSVAPTESLGAGGAQQGGSVRGVSIGLRGVTLLDQVMDTLSLAALSSQSGRAFDGILGDPLFTRCVVEIDYPRGCLSLYDAKKHRYRGGGVEVPIELIEQHPYVRARVTLPDGRSIEGKFVLDTGGAGGIVLSPDTVEREGVLASLGRTIGARAHGVGGGVGLRLGRAASLTLGGFTLGAPIVALQPAGAGRVSAPGTVGNIGGGILSRFKVTFDYRRKRVFLEPGPNLSDPFEADMSGLALVAAAPDFRRVRVARVLDGSPALEAGVRAGDEILGVDGTPASEVGAPGVRDRLRSEGRDVRLDLRRGEETISVTLRTRRMI